MKYTIKWTYNKKENYYFLPRPKLGEFKKLELLIQVLKTLMEDEILHMNPRRLYENDSLCEIESCGGQKYFQTQIEERCYF